jgi:ribulose 1,5-bisphosphate carboxylase large subunit-like protein
MEQKEMVVDLENLKKEDFLEMAQYIQHLEGLLDKAIEKERELKAYAVTLSTQRNQEHQRYLQMKEMYDNKINVVDITPKKATIEIHSNLTNPEQYREKKQF